MWRSSPGGMAAKASGLPEPTAIPRTGHPGVTPYLSSTPGPPKSPAGPSQLLTGSSLSRRPLPRLNLCSACGPMAMMRRHGLQSFGLTQRRLPAVRASLKLPFGVGSASPERAMSARARHTLLTCRLRLVRCCSRSRGRVLPGPSPPCRPMGPSSSPVPTSASSCSAACACSCRLPRAPADAVAMRRHGTMIPPPKLTKIVAPSRMQRQSGNQTQRRQWW